MTQPRPVYSPIPCDIADLVDDHVDDQIRTVVDRADRAYFDYEGVDDLHRLAERIYAAGYVAGLQTERSRKLAEQARDLHRWERQAARDAGAANLTGVDRS